MVELHRKSLPVYIKTACSLVVNRYVFMEVM